MFESMSLQIELGHVQFENFKDVLPQNLSMVFFLPLANLDDLRAHSHLAKRFIISDVLSQEEFDHSSLHMFKNRNAQADFPDAN